MCNLWQGTFPTENSVEDSFRGVAPVRAFPQNDFALFSLTGNTWEWCADWFHPTFHIDAPRANPVGPATGTGRVLKGGSYLCHASYCNRYRVAARTSNTPDSIEESDMPQAALLPPEDLWQALRQMLRSPLRTLVPPWSWKAATFNAILRAGAFFVTNLRSGHGEATKAMLVEAVFAVFAGGLIGAISQQLRKAKPLWATALLVWAGLPGIMVLAQFLVHRLARTPHLGAGLLTSFCLAAIASSFSWYAMRQGAMLGGTDETTVRHDIESLPAILLRFVLVIPRRMTRRRGVV